MVKLPHMKYIVNWDLDMPEDADHEQALAYQHIMDFIIEHELTDTGGCRVFYTPEEWKLRGEVYGRDSLLIVVHDGGDHAPAFNLDYGMYDISDKLREHMRKEGYMVEQCTSWYSAVYKD